MLDILFTVCLTILALALISFYINANLINTGYPDWLFHGFRINQIKDFGFASWSHSTSNGINLWRTYQFVPHYLTLIPILLFKISTAKAMVYMTIFVFIAIRLEIYVILRLLKHRPLPSLAASLLSFTIASMWGGFNDYSLMFSYLFFPIFYYAWIKYHTGKISIFFVYLIGISFFIHPVLAYSMLFFWILSLIFTSRKILSRRTLLEITVFLMSSMLFWYPLVTRFDPIYSNGVFTTTYFLQLTLRSYDYFGLSRMLLVILAGLLIINFVKQTPQRSYHLLTIVFVFSFYIFVIVGVTLRLPAVFNQLQFSRAISVVGIAICLASAEFFEIFLNSKILALKAIIALLILLFLFDGTWYSSIYSAQPAENLYDPVNEFLLKHPEKTLTDGRIYTATIGSTAYLLGSKMRIANSYMQHIDSNLVDQRLSEIVDGQPAIDVLPAATVSRLQDYLELTGSKYIFLDAQSPFVASFIESYKDKFKDLGLIDMPYGQSRAFEKLGQNYEALLMSTANNIAGVYTHKVRYANSIDQIALDEYVKGFVKSLDASHNIPLKVSYPTQESIHVQIPANSNKDTVYLNTSYSTGWTALFNGRKQVIQRVGPSFMTVKLDDSSRGGVLVLQHRWPLYFYLSLLLMVSLPLIFLNRRIIFYIFNI